MNILITGGLGFLGRNLTLALQREHKITILDICAGKEDASYGFNEQVSIKNPNIIGLDELFISGSFDVIIHTATLFGRNNETMADIAEANLIFPLKILDTAIKFKVKTFINTDSSLPRNTSYYSLSKKQWLEWLQMLNPKVQVINMVLEHFYGPGASNSNFITVMIKKMLVNERNIALTAGEQHRDFIYIDDVVKAYLLVLNEKKNLPGFSEFEIGTGKPEKLKDLLNRIHDLTHSNSELDFGAIPYRENELMQSQCNNSSIVKLGWKPMVDIEEGINAMIKYLKK